MRADNDQSYLVPESCGIHGGTAPWELGGLATMFVALDILLRQYAVRQAFCERKIEVDAKHVTSAARLLNLL